jgi:hypothetical protein
MRIHASVVESGTSHKELNNALLCSVVIMASADGKNYLHQAV